MRDEAGFTLVELLVAMLAGSALLALLSWNIATLGREVRVETASNSTQAIAAVAPQLTTLIEGALPGAPNDTPPVLEKGELSLVTAPPQALGPVGPVRLTLSVDRDRTGEALTAHFEPIDEAIELPPVASAEQRLVGGMKRIDLDYVEPDSGTAGLPRLVRLSFDSGQGEPVVIAAAPRINASGACRFDLISMTCRP